MTKFFDREGKPLELLEWARKYEDNEYQQVALNEVNGYTLSTIWTGFDARFEGLNHFESACWPTGDREAFAVVSTATTEAEALSNHAFHLRLLEENA